MHSLHTKLPDLRRNKINLDIVLFRAKNIFALVDRFHAYSIGISLFRWGHKLRRRARHSLRLREGRGHCK